MRLVSFNPYRTLGMPGVTYVKPELMFRQRDDILAAVWVLFPEYWQVNALSYGLRKRIFPSVASYHLGHDKVEMTRAFWSLVPRHVPDTLIVAGGDSGVEEVLERFSFPFVLKEPRSAMGRGVHLVESRSALRALAATNPVLYTQEFLPIHRDLRVVYVGDSVVCAYWRQGSRDFRNNVAQGGEVSFDGVPEAPLRLVESVARSLGIDHAGFDLAEVDGHWYLLEFNTLFGNEALNARGIRLGPLMSAHLERSMPVALETDWPPPLPAAC